VPLTADEQSDYEAASEAMEDNGTESSILPQGGKPIVKTWEPQFEDELASYFIELQDMGRIRERYR
jgi:hypothetical protein